MNVLKHVFINLIFTKLAFLCMAHLIMHYTDIATVNNLGAWTWTLLCRLTSTTCYNNRSVQEAFTFSSIFMLYYFFIVFFLLHLDISC